MSPNDLMKRTADGSIFATDSGLVCIALQVYAQFVREHGGPEELQTRALELSHQFQHGPVQLKS